MNIRKIGLLSAILVSFSAWASLEPVPLKAQWGFSDRQGKRPTMEDDYVVRQIQLSPFSEPVEYFGLFDGHGGARAAQFAAKYAPTFFAFSYKGKSSQYNDSAKLIHDSFISSYTQLDKAMQELYERDGTTAVSALIVGDTLHVAWAGDSRALVFDENGAIKFATIDHKPNEKNEKKRIKGAGELIWLHAGIVPRVGILAVSRTLGDRKAKDVIKPGAIIPHPDIEKVFLKKGDVIVLACDGVFEKLNNEKVASFIAPLLKLDVDQLRKKFPSAKPEQLIPNHIESFEENCTEKLLNDDQGACDRNRLTLIARGLRDKAIEAGSSDNVSAMVIQIT